MRLFVDFTQLLNHPCGISFYIVTLYRKLLEMYPELEISTGQCTLRSDNFRDFSNAIKELISGDISIMRRRIPGGFSLEKYPFLLKLLGFHTDTYDLVHLPGNYAPSYIPISSWSNTILTIHDLYTLHAELPQHRRESRWLQDFRALVSKQAKQARHIVTDSEFSKNDIVEKLQIPPEKITVIPLAVQWDGILQSTDYEQLALPSEQLTPRGFFLSVSNISPHKNFEGLLDAWTLFHHDTSYNGEKLVIVGGGGYPEILSRIQTTPDVIHLMRISTPQLQSLYYHAAGFFSLSFFEGFGLPLLEAMTLGCPACYALGNSMTEIGRHAAVAVHPQDQNAIVQAFKRFQNWNQDILNQIQLQTTIAAEYSWENTAQKTMELFQRIATNPNP